MHHKKKKKSNNLTQFLKFQNEGFIILTVVLIGTFPFGKMGEKWYRQ